MDEWRIIVRANEKRFRGPETKRRGGTHADEPLLRSWIDRGPDRPPGVSVESFRGPDTPRGGISVGRLRGPDMPRGGFLSGAFEVPKLRGRVRVCTEGGREKRRERECGCARWRQNRCRRCGFRMQAIAMNLDASTAADKVWYNILCCCWPLWIQYLLYNIFRKKL
jgi:hypothetical protein